jgi:hypothetical protein
MIGCLMNGLWHSGAFLAEQKVIIIGKSKIIQASACSGGEENEAATFDPSILIECGKRIGLRNLCPSLIVERGFSKGLLGHRKACRPDNHKRQLKTGHQSNDRSHIIRIVWLKKTKTQSKRSSTGHEKPIAALRRMSAGAMSVI